MRKPLPQLPAHPGGLVRASVLGETLAGTQEQLGGAVMVVVALEEGEEPVRTLGVIAAFTGRERELPGRPRLDYRYHPPQLLGAVERP